MIELAGVDLPNLSLCGFATDIADDIDFPDTFPFPITPPLGPPAGPFAPPNIPGIGEPLVFPRVEPSWDDFIIRHYPSAMPWNWILPEIPPIIFDGPIIFAATGNPNVDGVIDETLNGRGNITSVYTLTQDEVIEAIGTWVGDNDIILDGDQGVWRASQPNADDTFNQARVDPSSLAGAHDPGVPHFHLEVIRITPRKEESIVNNHIPFIP